MLQFLGERWPVPWTKSSDAVRIATVFPETQTIVTLPGTHATQRQAYLENARRARAQAGLRPWTPAEEFEVKRTRADLIIDEDVVLIRPEPTRMDLALAADELLQQLLPKRRVRFLLVQNPMVRDAIMRRGEAWRMLPIPQVPGEMARLIKHARIAVGGRAIYYYNATSGTRMLTLEEWRRLADLPEAEFRAHLGEIVHLSRSRNAQYCRELEFFLADDTVAEAVGGLAPESRPVDELKRLHAELAERWARQAPPEYQADAPDHPAWRNRMFAALTQRRDDMWDEHEPWGLAGEFFMQVRWLPGARVEEGELIFDPVFDQPLDAPEGVIDRVGEMQARGLICNLFQEYGDIEYVNIGQVINQLGRRHWAAGSRRDVYVAQIKQRGAPREYLRIIRMQKWGVREHLDRNMDLLNAMIQSERYTEYILDRRLASRQLGMNLASWTSTRKLTETYINPGSPCNGMEIWSPYFQRDYIPGRATDKLPASRLKNPAYALALAHLLGRAAATNIIVGRRDTEGVVIFDDGDEILIEDEAGTPVDMVVSAHTGSFADFQDDLAAMAPAYAGVVTRRAEHLPDKAAFTQAYLDSFAARFHQLQDEYRRRRRAFDGLFRHRRCDPQGNLAFRWQCVLRRLDTADVEKLVVEIRRHIDA